jgi:hypothetical protein
LTFLRLEGVKSVQTTNSLPTGASLMNQPTNKNQPIVCDLTVFPADVRAELAASVPELFQAVQQVHELPDGYAFQFANEPGRFMALAHFVEHERQCCPFYHFALECEPNSGPFWLRMTGSDEVKQFMDTVWSNLQDAVPMQLMKTGPGPELDEVISQAAPVLAEAMAKAVPYQQEEA